jgi:hypothetical protein
MDHGKNMEKQCFDLDITHWVGGRIHWKSIHLCQPVKVEKPFFCVHDWPRKYQKTEVIYITGNGGFKK